MSEIAPVPVSEETPQWASLRQLVVDSVSSEHSRRVYGFALDGFFAWYRAAPRGPFQKRWSNNTAPNSNNRDWLLDHQCGIGGDPQAGVVSRNRRNFRYQP